MSWLGLKMSINKQLKEIVEDINPILTRLNNENIELKEKVNQLHNDFYSINHFESNDENKNITTDNKIILTLPNSELTLSTSREKYSIWNTANFNLEFEEKDIPEKNNGGVLTFKVDCRQASINGEDIYYLWGTSNGGKIDERFKKGVQTFTYTTKNLDNPFSLYVNVKSLDKIGLIVIRDVKLLLNP
jgi:hypothetical protein